MECALCNKHMETAVYDLCDICVDCLVELN
jgi:hypothetical protein